MYSNKLFERSLLGSDDFETGIKETLELHSSVHTSKVPLSLLRPYVADIMSSIDDLYSEHAF